MAEQETAKVFLDVKMPEGTFTITQFKGVERLSAPFEYTLSLASTSNDVDFNSVMGQSATVSMKIGDETRSFSGIIGHFEQDDTPFKSAHMQTNYRAILYPKLWLLTFAGQCRIFQNKSTIDIIQDILKEHEVAYSNQVTNAGMQALEYVVQYNETDFAFISRLMEKEGIFYFFQQSEYDHQMVLADSPSSHTSCPNASEAGFWEKAMETDYLMRVTSCYISQRIVPKGASYSSYNYLTPQTILKGTTTGNENAGGGTLTRFEQIFHQQSRGEELSKITLQSLELPQKMVSGLSTVPFFLAGYKFELKDHPREDANQEYVLYEVTHKAKYEAKDKQGSYLYENSYSAFPSSVPFKAPQITPKPRIFSTQTAKVTGEEDEEIYTEDLGRIKVKFFWDPSENDDDTTSCWIRVATLWAGQGWGSLFTPRVGQEVVVSFIDGDPDKPLIVGSVYNADHKPPYLPDTPTKSTIKSQSSKAPEEGEAGFNEFRFEDKQGSEEIYLHAQKDLVEEIINNQTTTLQEGSRTTTLQAKKEAKGNDSLTLMRGDKSLKIEEGNLSEELLKGNKSVTLTDGNHSFQILKGNETIELLEGNRDITLTNGNYTLTLTEGNISITCLSGDIALSATGGDITLETPEAVTITAGEATITAEEASITSGSVTVDAGSATINAGEVSVEAGEASINAGSVNVDAGIATVNAGVVSIDGGECNISSGAVTIESGAITAESGVISLTAGAIALNGFVTIDGQLPVVI